jgi:hypothetical protein
MILGGCLPGVTTARPGVAGVLHHAMVFPLPKWLIKKIDKLRRNFFWKGEEVKGNKGGMCLVKWDIVCRQKELGGLGIHDLSMFGRALCQRWCWYHWTDNDRPWKGMTLSCDEDGMSLFQASTVIRVGDGKTSFLAGQMARRHGTKGHCPEPLQKARFKKRTVTRELPTKNWMHVARYISSREELLEFINLWVLLMNVNLNEEEHDSIGWKWTASGDYSATSAYKIQFQGSHNLFKIGHLWKAKVEPKVKVFGWTTMHQKLPTPNILAARGMQATQVCALCNSNSKDAHHLLIDCTFSRQVIHHIWAWQNFEGNPPQVPPEQGAATWLTTTPLEQTHCCSVKPQGLFSIAGETFGKNVIDAFSSPLRCLLTMWLC